MGKSAVLEPVADKPAEPKPMSPAELVKQKLDETKILNQAAEELIFGCVRDERRPDADEILLLKRVGLDTQAVEKAMSRAQHVLNLQATCGSGAEREAAKRRAADADAAATSRLPGIDEQLAKLNAERQQILVEQESARRDLQNRNDAVERLKLESLSEFQQERLRLKRREIDMQFSDLGQIQGRISALKGLTGPELDLDRQDLDRGALNRALDVIRSHTEQFEPPHPLAHRFEQGQFTVNNAAWREYRQKLQGELIALQSQADDLRQRKAEAIATAEKECGSNRYVPA